MKKIQNSNSWKHLMNRSVVSKWVVTSGEQDNFGKNPNVYKSFGQKTRQNAAPVFSDALAFDPVTIDDLNHLEHFIFRTIHILRKNISGFLDPLLPPNPLRLSLTPLLF